MCMYVENYYFIKVLLYNRIIYVIILFINNFWFNCLFICGKVIIMRVLYFFVDVYNVLGVLEVSDVVVI